MKKKGFTLIELLAVLVILAIIALIITPIVTNLIKDARIKSAENATEGLLEAVHVYYGRQVMLNNGVFNDNKKQTVEFDGAAGGNSEGTVDGDTAIEFNGFKVTDGSLTINRYGKVQIKPSDQLLVNGYYCINNGNKAYCDETEINPDDVGVYVTASELLTENVVTSGDGLYADSNNPGEYYYRGANPDNYIQFNNEVWRIHSINSTGEIKIIKNASIGNMAFSEHQSRTTGYCVAMAGDYYATSCNAWAKTDNFINGSISGVVEEDASLNTFLNTEYKQSLSGVYQYVASNMTWNVGAPGVAGSNNDTLTIEQQEENEKVNTWVGDIALLTRSEHMKANSNSNCLTAKDLSTNISTCKTTNYLRTYYWLIAPSPSNNYGIQFAGNSYGSIDGYYADRTDNAVRPVLYLKSNVILQGVGSNDENIYKIVGLAE